MPAADYYRFIDIFKDTDLFFLDCEEKDKRTWQHFGKLMMRGTLFNEYVKQNYNCNKGIFIDIFPLLPVPPTNTLRGKARDLWVMILNPKCLPKEFLSIGKPHRPILSSLFNAFSHALLFWCSSTKAREIRKKYLAKHSQGSSEFVNLGDNLLSRVPSNFFDEITTGAFEGKEVSIPKKWDDYLTWVYGDYMKFPPESERIPHHYVCSV